MNRFMRAAAAAGVAGAACVIGVPSAFAHEQRQVGAYQLTVGWSHEPTYVGEQNAIQLFVHDAKGNPIDELGSPPTLQVEAINGSQTSPPLDLEASFDPDTGLGTHGEFDSAIVPTVAGNYTFHFFGTINGQKVDERFTSGPSTFNTVQDPTGIQFPAKVPTVPDLATLTNRLSSRVGNATQVASHASDKANSSHTLGIVGVILGAAGLVAGVALGGRALSVARRRPASNPASTPQVTTPGG
ncbi:MAG TPA: hypothetical protein VMO88_14715 [Acidimicrobiales bacterium]|nr:hypothetical protein [Acidimicrobiales bacterium]